MMSGLHRSGSIRFGFPPIKTDGCAWTRVIRTSMQTMPSNVHSTHRSWTE